MATYIVDSTGTNNAELIGDFTTNDVAQTVTFNSGTDGEAKPLKTLETTRAWIVVEVREVGGTAGVIGKHVYSENVADIQTRVEAIRQEMIALHSTFIINCTHYKTGNVCDVYRGDKATVVALASNDTDTSFTPPAVWVIDDLTAFSPEPVEVSGEILVDPGFDDPTKYGLGTGWTISGSEAHANLSSDTNLNVLPAGLNTPMVNGATYTVGIECTTLSAGNFRIYIGTVSTGFAGSTGVKSWQITCNEDGAAIKVQGVNSLNASFDNFTVVRN